MSEQRLQKEEEPSQKLQPRENMDSMVSIRPQIDKQDQKNPSQYTLCNQHKAFSSNSQIFFLVPNLFGNNIPRYCCPQVRHPGQRATRGAKEKNLFSAKKASHTRQCARAFTSRHHHEDYYPLWLVNSVVVKLKSYFQAHSVVVWTNVPFRQVMHKPDLMRRVSNGFWNLTSTKLISNLSAPSKHKCRQISLWRTQ